MTELWSWGRIDGSGRIRPEQAVLLEGPTVSDADWVANADRVGWCEGEPLSPRFLFPTTPFDPARVMAAYWAWRCRVEEHA